MRGEHIKITNESLTEVDEWFAGRMANMKRCCEINIQLGLPMWDGFWTEYDSNRFNLL